jgi:hypothetical protein
MHTFFPLDVLPPLRGRIKVGGDAGRKLAARYS